MSLQLVIGSSGAGKSHDIYEEVIKESKLNMDKNFLLVVPEQFTLQTQKNIVGMNPDRGILNIDVLSFMRLAYRVFDELGVKNSLVLEDTGKNMIIRKVIEQKKEELSVFKGSLRKQGFIAEIKSLISELYQYSISEEDIESIIEKSASNKRLQLKFTEVLVIFKAFKEYLSDKYITTEEILDILFDVVDNSKLIKDSIICLDGFTGFTPIQYKLLSKLIVLCDKVIVSVTIDNNEDIMGYKDEHKLFSMSKKTISKLVDIAKDNNIKIDDIKMVTGMNGVPYRYINSPAMAHLEANIFRYPYIKYENEQDEIRVYAANSIDKEIDHVICSIRNLIEEKGYRYRDIAIISGDISTYGRIFEKKLKNENMPYFIDNKKGIMDNPMIEMICAYFEIINTNFSYDSVFRYLRCGMSGLNKNEVDALENYVIALGKRGINAWSKEWVRTYYTRSRLNLIAINESRQKVCDELALSVKEFKNSTTIKEFCVTLYNFLTSRCCEEKLIEYAEYFEKQGELTKAKEYEQVYSNVMELLDKMVSLLGDESASIKEYSEIFMAGIEEIKVGTIPMTIDQIVIGDIERTRLNDVKALFFVGVNDGIVPKSGQKGGLISDLERELLVDMGVELSPTCRQTTYIEQFYLYIALTRPYERLYVSYFKMDSEGKTARESYLVSKLLKLFSKLEIEEGENSLDELIGNNYGLDYIADGLRKKNTNDMSEEWKQLATWYMNDDELKNKFISLTKGAYYTTYDNGISKAVADTIYGYKDKSVTEIEKYASCAYAHFLQYGLKLCEKAEYEIRVPDFGLIFHDVMDKFSNGIKASGYDWKSIPDKERCELSERCVDEAVAEFGNYIMFSNKRNEYLINRIKRMASRTTWALCNHVREGEFIPTGFEVAFSSSNGLAVTNQVLDDGRKIGLRGAIDRLDISEDIDKEYVKVIDYKSGNRTFEPALFSEGIQLQLIVYMNVAVETRKKMNPNKEIVPAGVFYYTIDDPIVDKDNGEFITEELIDNKKKEKLVMKGIVNKNPEVLKRIEKNLVDENGKIIPKKKSIVIKVATSSDGQLKSNANAVSNKEFEVLRRHAAKIIAGCSNDMYNGVIRPNPYKLSTITACEYCSYKGICRFDVKLSECKYKKIYPKSMEDVIKDE